MRPSSVPKEITIPDNIFNNINEKKPEIVI